jgi:hypothetical protein
MVECVHAVDDQHVEVTCTLRLEPARCTPATPPVSIGALAGTAGEGR